MNKDGLFVIFLFCAFIFLPSNITSINTNNIISTSIKPSLLSLKQNGDAYTSYQSSSLDVAPDDDTTQTSTTDTAKTSTTPTQLDAPTEPSDPKETQTKSAQPSGSTETKTIASGSNAITGTQISIPKDATGKEGKIFINKSNL